MAAIIRYIQIAILNSLYSQYVLMVAMAWTVQEHVVTVKTMSSVTSQMASVPPAVHQGTTEGSVCWPVATVRQGQCVSM